MDESGSARVRWGNSDLYGYVDNEPTDGADPSGLKFGIWNDKTGWTSESGDDVFKRLVTQLGGQPANMQALKDSDLWKNLVDSPTWIEVKFLKMGGNTKGEGGRTYKDDFMGGISSTVGPDMANNPKGLLANFIHEMIHAAVLARCKLVFNGNVVLDRNNDRDNFKIGKGYGKYPGTNYQNDINITGQDLIDWLTQQIGPPGAFPKPRPPSEDPPPHIPGLNRGV